MDMDFDLESLAHVEQSFYDAGYADGFAHGRIHGLIEGRALGREKGFEIWEELGFYEGFARTWRALLSLQRLAFLFAIPYPKRGTNRCSRSIICPSSLSSRIQYLKSPVQFRAFQHLRHLLESLSQFPRANPSATDASSEFDVVRLVRQIRSRYKILCASLGVRPRLQPAEVDSEQPTDLDADMTMESDTDSGIVKSGESVALKQRVAPGSSIPVWKLDRTGAKRPVTNQDLDF
ncbi:hypothetical protein D9619_002470 [Psilocybe cf. subviscida]|uniref:Essential protein Yae1 N-terminal domain-containing protein n=1 Tax=Psilocybe cf. subviscida TaxID=2480587 RepID=A0A8H5EU71_9AGAR|nr:hypothetical protein D9619_002470 [Psilocybe cf. subviscida]